MDIIKTPATEEQQYLDHEMRVHDVRYPLSRLHAEEVGERDWDEKDKWFTGIYPGEKEPRGPVRDFEMKDFIRELIEELPGFDGWDNWNWTWDIYWYGTERWNATWTDPTGKRHAFPMLKWLVAHHDYPRKIIKPLQIIKKEVRITYTKKGVEKREDIYLETPEMREVAMAQLPEYPDKDYYIEGIKERLTRLEAQAKRNLQAKTGRK